MIYGRWGEEGQRGVARRVRNGVGQKGRDEGITGTGDGFVAGNGRVMPRNEACELGVKEGRGKQKLGMDWEGED